MAFGVLAMVALALQPLAIGAAIDSVVGMSSVGDSGGGLAGRVAVVLALGAVQAVSLGIVERCATELWIRSALGVQREVLGHAARVGAALPRRIRAGDVVAVGSSDIYSIGNLFEVLGRAAGSLVAFVLVAVILLAWSPVLGALVLIGVPLATAGVAPLLGPLRRRLEAHREQVGATTSMAADIVSGLRVLRGIGGERRFADRFAETSQRVRRAGVAVARRYSWLTACEVLLPGLVTVGVVWLGARLVLAGAITVGELVACYGLSAFLVLPVGVASEAARNVGEAQVAARRVITILRLPPELVSPKEPVPLPAGPLGLYDPDSGLSCPAGRLTVIAASRPSEVLADRFARFVDSPVRAGGVPLRAAELAEVRRRIVLAHNQDVLFAGRLGVELDLATGSGAVDLHRALHAADAIDVVAGLPGGLRERLTERGRELSGGQRQRLMLARALTAGSDVLVLDDPTSAVDAHTEARIAPRVRALRAGRTTVVISHSPLWAAVADTVLNESLYQM